MPAYYDTGVIVPLFVEESFSRAVDAVVVASAESIALHAFHRLEVETALRLKVFRRECSEDSCRIALDKIASAIREGRLIVRPVDWIAALEDARRIGETSASVGCRTLDLIHVAVALQWRCDVLVSADDRQLRAARQAGLGVVDVRAPPPGPAAAVREPRVEYNLRRVRSVGTKRRGPGRASRVAAKETA